MKAAVYTGPRRLEMREVPTPKPGPGQVLIKVKYCAICGTDVHGFLFDAVTHGTILGHEYSGVIAQVGPGVTQWEVGQRVVGLGGTPPPGAPLPSQGPRFNYRTQGLVARRPGGYAEYVLLEAWEPLAIPEGVPDEAACLAEPCSVAVHAVRHSKLRVGEPVAVIGAGPIGLLCIQVAKAAGAGDVYVSEPAPARTKAALESGAAAVVDPTRQDPVERMVQLTGGLGPSVVYECAAAEQTLQQSLDMVRRGGQVVVVSLAWKPQTVLSADWIAREIELKTTYGSTRSEEWLMALDLMRRGLVRWETLINADCFVPLDGIHAAFEGLTRPSTQLQLVVKF